MAGAIYYINIPKLTGSSANPRHIGASEIQYLDFINDYQPLINGIGSGEMGREVWNLTGIIFQLDAKDVMTPYLMQIFSSSRVTPEMFITIEFLDGRNELRDLRIYRLNDCVIDFIRKVPDSHNLSYSISFRKFEVRNNWIETW